MGCARCPWGRIVKRLHDCRRFCRCAVRLCLAFALLEPVSAAARVGFGDPIAPWRARQPEQWLMLDGYFRSRAALYGNLDLDRGPSPSSNLPLWPAGEGPLDWTTGTDLRLRLRPSLFFGDEVRVFIEADVIDGLSLGESPRGTPYQGHQALVAGTAFQSPLGIGQDAWLLRSAYAEVLLPLGVLSVGRMPSHFGMGIAANAGDEIDDDQNDRADRIAWVSPLFGHFLAMSWDISAAGARLSAPVSAPDVRRFLDGQQALSLAFLRYQAPWESELYRKAGKWVFNYGAALTFQAQAFDTPNAYLAGGGQTTGTDSVRMRRDYRAWIADFWLRSAYGPFRLEAEFVWLDLHLGNASPWPGVSTRNPIVGNPFGAVVQAEYDVVPSQFSWRVEGGIASGDPAYGFTNAQGSQNGAGVAGDVFAPQIDGSRDLRLDAFRFHPSYRVDLILWRSLLGGVSEAAYGKTSARLQAFDVMELETSAIYSHAIYPQQSPGGAGPLAVEIDGACTLRFGPFSVRTDAGLLFPLTGLQKRERNVPFLSPAHMILLRFGYEA